MPLSANRYGNFSLAFIKKQKKEEKRDQVEGRKRGNIKIGMKTEKTYLDSEQETCKTHNIHRIHLTCIDEKLCTDRCKIWSTL